MRSWSEDLNGKGSKGEELIKSWFGGTLGYNDILINSEIKNNWHGGDLCIEESSVVEQDKPGWIYTTKADNIIFLDYENEQAVIIEAHELKRTYMKIKDRYELRTQTTDRNGNSWHSTHRWIPINKFSYTYFRRITNIYSVVPDCEGATYNTAPSQSGGI
jgi:hypothetical protein